MPDLQQTVRELAAAAESVPLTDAIQQAVDAAARLYSVTGSGVMFADGEHVLHYIAASDGHGRELEHAQERAGMGPCVDALVEDRVVQTTDVTADPRWPAIHEDLEKTRVRAVLGLPIHVAGTVIGSLDVYRDHAGDWPRDEIDAMIAFAGLVERLLLAALNAERHERTVEQLEYALEHRVTIERAVGVLMERERIDATEAFRRLRAASRASRRRAAELAEEILQGSGPSDQ